MTLIVRCSCYPEKQDENFPFIVYLSFPPKCRWSIGSCRISYHFHELGEILNGCLVKERKFVYSGARRGSAKGQANSNRTSCSLACREKKECNLFMLDNKSKTCYLLRGGTMASSEVSSAGFCPKSKFYQIQMNLLSLLTMWAPTRQTKLFEQQSRTQAFPLLLEVLKKRQDQGLPVSLCLQGRNQVGLCGGDTRTSLQCEGLRANPNIWGNQQLPPVWRMLSKCP